MKEKDYALVSDLTRVRIVVKTLADVSLFHGMAEEEELLKQALQATSRLADKLYERVQTGK